MGEESPEDAAKGPVHKSIKIFTLKAPTLWKLCNVLDTYNLWTLQGSDWYVLHSHFVYDAETTASSFFH